MTTCNSNYCNSITCTSTITHVARYLDNEMKAVVALLAITNVCADYQYFGLYMDPHCTLASAFQIGASPTSRE